MLIDGRLRKTNARIARKPLAVPKVIDTWSGTMNHEEQGFKPDNKSRDNDNSNHTPDHNQSEPQNESETEHPLAAEIRRWIADIPINDRPTFANCLKFKWAFAEKIQSQTKILYGDNRIPLAQQIKQDFDHVASVIRDFDVHCEKRCYEDDEAEILESKHQRIETLGNNLANLIAGRCRLPQSHLNSRQQERLKTETQRRGPIRIEATQPAPQVPAVSLQANTGTGKNMVVEWKEDAAEFISNSDAIKLSDDKITFQNLSKVLKPDGPIRYMKKVSFRQA
jgi:hypothetical protein